MTEGIFRIANNINEEIQCLKKKRHQVLDFDKILKERKPTEEEQSIFMNNMITIVDALINIKQQQFKDL